MEWKCFISEIEGRDVTYSNQSEFLLKSKDLLSLLHPNVMFSLEDDRKIE